MQKCAVRSSWGSKTLVSFLVLAVLVNQIFYGTAALAAPSAEQTAVLTPKKLTEWTLPKGLGRVSYVDAGAAGAKGPVLLLIEDAHAVPSAQESIRKIIERLQTQEGLKTIFFEGAEGYLDPLLFRALADKKNLKNVFNHYRDQGELSGVTLAAVLNPAEGIYEGVENQALYEDQINAWLTADSASAKALAQVLELKESLVAAESRHASVQLHQLNQAERAFEASQRLENWLKVLSHPETRAKVKNFSEKYPNLVTLFEEMKGPQDAKTDAAMRKELERVFVRLTDSVRSSASRELFEKRQEYLTEKISAGAWGSELVLFARRNKAQVSFPEILKTAVRQHRMLEKIQGHEFFEQLENYLAEVRRELIQTPADAQIEKLRQRLRLLEKLTRLELTRQEWNVFSAAAEGTEDKTKETLPGDLAELQVKQDLLDQKLSGPGSAFVLFYELALKREEIFWQKIQPKLAGGALETAAFVGGGFHTDGLRARLKQARVAHAVITPSMTLNSAQKDFYQKTMRGQISWGDKFDADSAYLEPYKAFSRAAVMMLSKQMEQPQMKLWRRAVKEAALKAGRSQELSAYDQIFLDKETSAQIPKAFLSQWRQTVDQFITGLKAGHLTAAAAALNTQKMTATAQFANPLVPEVRYPKAWRAGQPAASLALQRSEVRQNDDGTLLFGVHELHPEWWIAQVTAAVLLDKKKAAPGPVSFDQIFPAVQKKIKGLRFEGEWLEEATVRRVLDRLVNELGAVRRSGNAYDLVGDPRALAVKMNHFDYIRKEFTEALTRLAESREGATVQLEQLVTSYASATGRWPLYEVEARWPVLKAVSLMNVSKQKQLEEFLWQRNLLHHLPLVDSLLLMLQENPPAGWLIKQAPSLAGSTIYYVSPETWLAAGGLGRVGQYHTLKAEELINKDAKLVTIEPYYPFRLDVNGQPVRDVDYSKTPVPVEGVDQNQTPVMEFNVRVRRGGVDHRVDVTVQVYKGTNRFGMDVYLIKDKPIDGQEEYYTKLLYRYSEHGASSWEEFTEFMSKASVKLIKKLEKERAAAGKRKSPAVLWANDGQLGPLPVFKRISDYLDTLSPEERQRVRQDPSHPYHEMRDMLTEDNELSLVDSDTNMTTHTYRNRGRRGWEFVAGMKIPEAWRPYFRMIYDPRDANTRDDDDSTSGGVRAADSANGVAAIHAQEVGKLDYQKVVAITNGDDRGASRQVLTQIFNEPAFQAQFPKADPEFATPEQLVVAKRRAKELLRDNVKLQELDPEFSKIDPDRMVISYSGRLVDEKAGRDNALTNHNIRELVRAGAQVIILGNVQASRSSKEMFEALKKLQGEVNGVGPGRLIVATGWGIPEQRQLLPATDMQVNDSTRDPLRGTEAAGFTETDVAVNGGIEFTSPYLEAIFQQQGQILNWDEPGSGNTVIPQGVEPESYLKAMQVAVDMYHKNKLTFASFQATSIRLSRVLTARLPAAQYLRYFDQARSRKQNPVRLLKDYLAGDTKETDFFHGEWLREALISKLEGDSGALAFETNNPNVRAFLVPLGDRDFLRIVVIAKGLRNPEERISAVLRSGTQQAFSTLWQSLRMEEGDGRVAVLSSTTGQKFGVYPSFELEERGLYVDFDEGLQILDVIPIDVSTFEAPADVTRAAIFNSESASEQIQSTLLELFPSQLLQTAQREGYSLDDLVFWTPGDGFSPEEKAPSSWTQPGLYLLANKGNGTVSLSLMKTPEGTISPDRRLEQVFQGKGFAHFSLTADGDDLWVGFGKMNFEVEAKHDAFKIWLSENLSPWAKKFGFTRLLLRRRALDIPSLLALGFQKDTTRQGEDEIWFYPLVDLPAPPLSNLLLAQNVVDAGMEVVGTEVHSVAGLNGVSELEPLWNAQGVRGGYHYGIWEKSPSSRKAHAYLDGDRHRIVEGGVTLWVQNYWGKQQQLVMPDGTSILHVDNKGNIFSLMGMEAEHLEPELSSRREGDVIIPGSAEQTRLALTSLSENARLASDGTPLENVRVTYDFIGWLAPDAFNQRLKKPKDVQWTFFKPLDDQATAYFRSLPDEEAKQAFLDDLNARDGSFFVSRKGSGAQETVTLIKHVEGEGAPNIDQTMLNPFVPGVKEYYLNALKLMMKMGADSVRVDLAGKLLNRHLGGLFERWGREGFQTAAPFNPDREIMEELIREASIYSRDTYGRPFYFYMELYSKEDRDRYRQLARQAGFPDAVIPYDSSIFTTYFDMVRGHNHTTLRHFEGAVKHVFDLSQGFSGKDATEQVLVFPSNFDQIQLADIGGPVRGLLAQMILLADSGVQVMLDKRDLGVPVIYSLPGGDRFAGRPDLSKPSAHSDAVDSQFIQRSSAEGHRQMVVDAYGVEVLRGRSRAVRVAGQSYVQYLNTSNRESLSALAKREPGSNDWVIAVANYAFGSDRAVEGWVEFPVQALEPSQSLTFKAVDWTSEKPKELAVDVANKRIPVVFAPGQQHQWIRLESVQRSEVREAAQRVVTALALGNTVDSESIDFLNRLPADNFTAAVEEIQAEARKPSVLRLAYQNLSTLTAEKTETDFKASRPQFDALADEFLSSSIQTVRDTSHEVLLSDQNRDLRFSMAFPLQMESRVQKGLLDFAKMLQGLRAEYPSRVNASVLLLADPEDLANEANQEYLRALRRTGVAKIVRADDPQLGVITERFLRDNPNALAWGAFEDIIQTNRRIHLVRNREVTLKTALPFAFLLSRKLAEARFLTADLLKKVPESMRSNGGIAFNGNSLEITRFALELIAGLKARQLLEIAA